MDFDNQLVNWVTNLEQGNIVLNESELKRLKKIGLKIVTPKQKRALYIKNMIKKFKNFKRKFRSSNVTQSKEHKDFDSKLSNFVSNIKSGSSTISPKEKIQFKKAGLKF